MQTALADFIRDTPEGREADAILRKCVHCGFCTATCPTYLLLGDENDGPRGRIYLMKQALEGQEVTDKTRLHLDRCLTCRACETTCPSGVQYGRLLDIGRKLVEEKTARPAWERLKRRVLAEVLPRRFLFAPLVMLGRLARPFLPVRLAEAIPAPAKPGAWPAPRHARKMLALAGCVQPSLAPDINASAARVLDRVGISLIEAKGAGCCGALRFHIGYQEEGLADMRAMIDRWWPMIERGGVEAIAMTASGCGAVVKEYAHLLRHDPAYAGKAEKISAMTRDVCEVIEAEFGRIEPILARKERVRLAFHPPCTLQHGQNIKGVTEHVLARAGIELTPVPDAHLCCGSAGTYSILQPELSAQLKRNKLSALASGEPEGILTANIGCLAHLQSGAELPVRHWITALEERLN
jgi:glycolate oxidase iron-sulfur subunit